MRINRQSSYPYSWLMPFLYKILDKNGPFPASRGSKMGHNSALSSPKWGDLGGAGEGRAPLNAALSTTARHSKIVRYEAQRWAIIPAFL